MSVILCFGDSNTHGTPPMRTVGEYARFGADVRWPSRMARALGGEVVEEQRERGEDAMLRVGKLEDAMSRLG